MGMLRADSDTEAGVMPSADLMQRMGVFMEEVTRAGVLVATDGLQPSSKGARVRLQDGRVTVTDGPFTESKELIASYAIFDVPTSQEAIDWTTRFLEVLGEGECEIRPIWDFTDFPEDIFPPEAIAAEKALRDEMEERSRSQT
jgi:hypothetical protein